MKQIQAAEAFESLGNISRLYLPYDTIKNIRKIYNILKEENNFYMSENEKLIRKWGAKDTNNELIIKNDNITIPDMQGYLREKESLDNFEVEINIEPCIITEQMMNGQLCSISDIIALEGIITFT